MKQAKKILAMALTVVMLIAAVPPVALAAAEEAAYDVLAEYSWKGSFIGGTNWEDPELPNNTAIVREDNDGYYLAKISASGMTKLPEVYDYASRISNGAILVRNDAQYNIIDTSGNVIAPNVSEYVYSIWEGNDSEFIIVRDDVYYLYNVNDKTEKQISDYIAEEFIYYGKNESGLYPRYEYTEETGSFYRYINENDEPVLPGPYSRAGDFKNGYAQVVENDEEKIIDETGATVYSAATERIWGFYGDYMILNDANDLRGYQTLSGTTIPCQFKNAYSFNQGYAQVRYPDDQRAVIDTNGKEVFPRGTYANFGENIGDVFVVYDDNYKSSLVDVNGTVIVPSGVYDDIVIGDVYNLPVECFKVRDDEGNRGIIDVSGKTLLEPGNYYYINYKSSAGDFWCVSSDWNEYGVVDSKGNIIIPYGQYDSIYFTEDGLAVGVINNGRTSDVTVQILKLKGAQSGEYIYDTDDPGAGVDELLQGVVDTVTDEQSAVDAVKKLTDAMTAEQKASATGVDLATLLAESAAAKVASEEVTGREIIINAANVAPLLEKANSVVDAVDAALVRGGINTARYIANTVTLVSNEIDEITINVDPDILTTEVEKIRVETPAYAVTLKLSEIEQDLNQILVFKTSVIFPVLRVAAAANAVKLDLPNGKVSGPITLSFPYEADNAHGDSVVNQNHDAAPSKYNPATSTMDGKVTDSGTYSVLNNEKDFTDISDKSKEMQDAIKYLASRGIINGTSPTTFDPDGMITRGEIITLIVRALGKLDTSAACQFPDVATSSWYYAAVGSSVKCGLIYGYDDGTFRGDNSTLKVESFVIAARVLKSEMNYKEPADYILYQYLHRYSDEIDSWAQSEVALATRENLVVYRVDGTFSGQKAITRGDAAILLYRLFQKIW